MASAQHWDHKERYPAAAGAGGGDKHMCAVPPPITLRWRFSVGDRYGRIGLINFITGQTLDFASVVVLQPKHSLRGMKMNEK